MRTGFYIVGVLKGYKASTFTNRDTGEVKISTISAFNFKTLTVTAVTTPQHRKSRLMNVALTKDLKEPFNNTKTSW